MYDQTILLGVIISLIYTEITGLSAGLIISGYLVLNLQNPGRIVCTLVVALAAMGLCRLLASGADFAGGVSQCGGQRVGSDPGERPGHRAARPYCPGI